MAASPPPREEARMTTIAGIRHAAGLAALALVASAPASATFFCYTVYDRAGEIAYRDTVAPFEGALDPTSSGRSAMRARGEHLVFFEADYCPPVSRVVGLGSTSSRPPTTDEIVQTLPAMGAGGARTTGNLPASTPPGRAAAFGGPAARITAPAQNAVQTRMGTYR
jgi:hypothetical protein